ncbi:efflux RND transporter permease subunit [Helicobacter canis]|uniref:Efflux RND transporter permease subunit n=1 Tax=Helicobacter canis TaxID=29419 RepID=A0A5M9QPZ6_9HELI|nr:efflux RND transporter permease subunit [Helicobacter canis]KAA8710057.1 efflux RND transporter permease subunit [Helicobacter canis]
MLAKIIEWSLMQRIIVMICACALLLFGGYSFLSIAIDAFPDVSSTQVRVAVKAPGMAPEEVENRVVRPLELELQGLPGQKLLRSTSKYAIADIVLDFDDNVDIYLARQMTNERLANVLADLPSGVDVRLQPIVTPLSDMFMFTIEGNISNLEKRQLLDFIIRPEIRKIKGVADVSSLGGFAKAFVVVPDFNDMARLGVTITQLESVLEASLKNDGAGRVDRDGENFLVKIQNAALSPEQIAELAIQTNVGFVKIGDFAEVSTSYMTRLGFTTKNGVGETTQAIVLSLKGANSKETIEKIYEKFDELKPLLPEGVRLEVFYDRSDLTQKAVDNVTKVLIEAIVLIVVLLFLFLGDLRAAIAVSVILPCALSVAFICMSLNGMSANLMSLGGLAIAIGILVDSAVVMVENAFEKLSSNTTTTKLHALYRACKEISVSVVSGIIIIIVFFVPILTLEGLEGKMFAPLAKSIVFALLGSLVLSITVIPVVASLVLKTKEHKETIITRFFYRIYTPTLHFCLTHRKMVISFAFAFLVASLSLFPFVGKSFMPTLDEGDVVLMVEMTPSVSLTQSRDLLLRIQKTIKEKVPEVKEIVARTGTDELGLSLDGLNQSDMFISFIPKDQWQVKSKQEVLEKITQSLQSFVGISFIFTQPIDMRISEMLTGVRGDLAIKIFGDDIATLNELSKQIREILKGVRGSSEVFTTLNEGVNYLYITPEKHIMSNVGVSVDEFAKFMKSSLEGIVVSYIPMGVARVPVIIRQDPEISTDITKLEALEMFSSRGYVVPISSIAEIKEVDGPVTIVRENNRRMSVVRSNVENRDLGGFVDEAKEKIAAQVKLPPNYYITFGGQFENQQRANARFAVVIPISIVVIFFILYFTFKSVPLALLILLNIPFAVTGGLISLFLSGEYISVPASIGFITLFGIAVLNGVVMIGYFKELIKQGKSVDEAVEMGAKRRLRPILMTAFIAAFGLVPMLLSSGVGSEVQKPLAIVVLGGLVTSSSLTLLLLPAMFGIIAKRIRIV